MEYEKRIEELRKSGEANGGDPNELIEDVYWEIFRSSWTEGFNDGLAEGRKKAMSDLNISIKN